MASAWRSSASVVSPLLEAVARLAHVALGVAQRLARRLAGGAGQAVLQLLHQLAQRLLALGERLRVAAGGSSPGCAALAALAGLALAAAAELLLQLAERLVGEALLLAQRVGEALHRLLALAALALALLAALAHHHLHVLEHLLQHLEERLGLGAPALLGELLDAVHQLLDLVLGHRLARRDLGLLHLAVLDRLARHLLHVVAGRLAQLVHQPGDLLVGGVAPQRLLQPLLGARQPLGGVAEVAVLDLHRGLPERLGDLVADRGDVVGLLGGVEAADRGADDEVGARAVEQALGQVGGGAQHLGDAAGVGGRPQQVAALLDQRLRQRVVEAAHRQHRLDGRALVPAWPIASSATRRTVTGRPASGCLEKSSTSVSDSASAPPVIGSGRSAASGGSASGSTARP